MEELRLAEIESRFADIIWETEPIRSGELADICRERLGWARTTMYTVLKRLCERGFFQNVDGVVTSLVSKGDYHLQRGEYLINEGYDGSLPLFIAAFTKNKQLSKEEIRQIREMIDSAKED